MMPPVVAAFPLFFVYRKLGWIDTYHGLILVHAAMNVPLAVLLLMSFFNEIPRDLDDAAMVDGATRFGAFLNSLTSRAAAVWWQRPFWHSFFRGTSSCFRWS